MSHQESANIPDKKILTFYRKHHVMTLATVDGDQPWCANCFYAFDEERMHLIFTSGFETRHVKEVQKNPKVAGSVVLETNIVGKIQGIQFTGELYIPEKNQESQINGIYLKRFPFAALMNTTLWVLRIDSVKLTDNRLGFGKKLFWQRDPFCNSAD